MAKHGLLINYEYCTGCHSCEIACRNERKIDLGKWGIKMTEVGPFQLEERKWEWLYAPIPTSLCDLCEDRVAEGKKPACVHHCLASCIEYISLEDIAKRADSLDSKTYVFFK